MKSALRGFVAMLAFVAALLARVRIGARKLVNKIDPFDTRGIWYSHLWRLGRRSVWPAVIGFALVCSTVLPAAAMPIWAAKGSGALKFATMNRLGGLGAYSAATAMIGSGQKPPQLKPFRMGTVRRRMNIGNFAFVLGAQIPSITIPQVGALARVLVDVEGSYTVATAPLVMNLYDGMDSLVANTNIVANNGSAAIVSLSGVGVNATNGNIGDSLPIKRGTAGVGNVQGINLPLAVGASFFSYKYILPVNANQRKQFDVGLINLQAPELRVTIGTTVNSASTIVTTPANLTLFSATANFSYEYYEIPDLSKYKMFPLTLVRTLEEAPQPINALGVQTYQLPRLGTMFDYHGVLVLNSLYFNVLPVLGSPTNGITEVAIRYNKTDTQYDTFIGDWETYEAEIYGDGMGPAITPSASSMNPQTFLFPYMISWNMWAAGDGIRNVGDFRDAIDTEENTTTEMLITIGGGTTLHAGKDSIIHVRRVLQKLQQSVGPAQ